MRVPTVHYRKPNEPEEQRIDLAVTCILGAGVLMSAVVWALAIAKVIDLYGLK
jgi:molybdopterin/thiamine biosynthesis adenylyltransferase